MNRQLLIAVVCAVAALGVILVRQLGQGPSDVVQIKTAVDEAVAASKAGKPGPVLDFISRSLTLNADLVGGERGEIAKYIRNYRPDVEVLNFAPRITGDDATLVSPVKLKLKIFTVETEQTVPEVTLKFRREATFRYLIIPGRVWRLTDISVKELPMGLPTGP